MLPRTRARLEIVVAALLWSLSGFFSKALTEETALHLNSPPLDSLQIAFYRVFFAGLMFSPGISPHRGPPSRLTCFMAICFALLNVLFIGAMKVGTAANAIVLQYTAPIWVLVIGFVWLRERFERADLWLLAGGTLGMSVIGVGNWTAEGPLAVGLALGSGMAYAAVVLCLRQLRDQPSLRLTAFNHLGAALVLLPVAFAFPMPSPAQLAWLALFGCVQLALPYWLMARGLRHVPPLEAGLITLLEPVLNPLWAFLVSPATERPGWPTVVGGVIILLSLAVRYRPRVAKA